MTKILCIQLRQIGDVLLCTPSLRALREAYPDAHISFLAEPGPARVLEGNPSVDEIIIRPLDAGPLEPLKTILDIRSRRFDIVIDFMASPRTALLTKLSGASKTISYASSRRSSFYKIKADTETVGYSGATRMGLLKPLGINSRDIKPYIHLCQKTISEAKEILKSIGIDRGAPFVMMDSTHRRITRRWTRFGELADKLLGEFGTKSLFFWGPGEREFVEQIVENMKQPACITPELDLKLLAAIMGEAALLIGNDSAPRHIAAALDTPTITVLGSSKAVSFTFPSPIHRTVSLGMDCQPCTKNECKLNLECLEDLEPQMVIDEISAMAEHAPELGRLLQPRPVSK